MSLISLENLLEPLTNKVHLVAIILVMFVFAILRFNGGGFSIQKIETPRLHGAKRSEERLLREKIREAAAAPVKQVGATAPAAKSRKREHFMDKILREDRGEPVRQAAPPVQRRSKSVTQRKNAPTAEENLEDIERSLGLK